MKLTHETLHLTIDGTLAVYKSKELADTYGSPYVFDPEAMDGWDNSPDVKRDSTERPQAHGDYSSRGLYTSKMVTLTGHVFVTSPEQMQVARDTFVGALNDGQDHTIAVTKTSGTLYATMQQGGAVQWLRETDLHARFLVELYAADPRMYGGIRTAQAYSETRDDHAVKFPLTYPLSFGKPETVGRAVLSNAGNSPAYPTYTVNAYLPLGFSITTEGRSIVFGGTTFEGSPVVIDTYAGTASVSGLDRSYQLMKRDWTPIPPRGTLAVEFAPLGGLETAAWADVTYRDTYT
ncbi:hypothetical protein F7P69_00800 [Cellulosimicrobium funkei]|nr:hypothetical protein [Cellulosimicrobium funkei]